MQFLLRCFSRFCSMWVLLNMLWSMEGFGSGSGFCFLPAVSSLLEWGLVLEVSIVFTVGTAQPSTIAVRAERCVKCALHGLGQAWVCAAADGLSVASMHDPVPVRHVIAQKWPLIPVSRGAAKTTELKASPSEFGQYWNETAPSLFLRDTGLPC